MLLIENQHEHESTINYHSNKTKMNPNRTSHTSLIRYDTPFLISTTNHKRRNINEEKTNLTPTEDILNSILPPREWTEDGNLWVQYVSSTPATRSEITALSTALDAALLQKQARETGICPIREEIYAQCFDELIRQVTIHCNERGLLLLRLRDELKLTVVTYQMLYESSIAFGIRKALTSDSYRTDITTHTSTLEKEIDDAIKERDEWRRKCDELEKREQERSDEEGRRQADEIDALKRNNAQLKKDLETLLSVPASALTGVAASVAATVGAVSSN